MRGGLIARVLSAARRRYAARRRHAFLKALKPAVDAPYAVSLYRDFLMRALGTGPIKVLGYRDSPSTGRASLFVRHDIDTADCGRKMRLLLDIDREAGVSPGVYFRADEEAYRLAELRNRIEPYRSDGFEIGLHTVCYVHDDYLRAFEMETRVFRDAFGFSPTSFTVHGLGTHRHDVRMRFCDDVCERLEDFGYGFSDCCPKLRSYDYVIHDCHFDAKRDVRFVYDDFAGRDFPYAPGMSYVVLTHPCYWT